MRLIFVVTRSQVARLESLRASLVGADDVLIVADRREAERRQPEADGTADAPRRDRRHGDRRTTDVDGSLRAIGWALVEQSS